MFYSDKKEGNSVVIPLELIEELKDFDVWKEFKNNPSFLNDRGCEIIKEDKKQVHFIDPWDNFSGTHFGY
jgi:hypothetical protein